MKMEWNMVSDVIPYSQSLTNSRDGQFQGFIFDWCAKVGYGQKNSCRVAGGRSC